MKSVLVYFSDNSLGGTSRSALLMGLSWQSIGFIPEFFAAVGVHESRLSQFSEIGHVVTDIEDINWSNYSVIHLHHGLWGSNEREFLRSAKSDLSMNGGDVLLLTHNIFGERTDGVHDWSGPRCISVLGVWSGAQLVVRDWPLSGRTPIRVLPNPQLLSKFRPPNAVERVQARNKFAPGAEHVILRVGSPHAGKWSKSYLRLARRLRSTNTVLLLVGVPPFLSNRLAGESNVRVLPLTGSDSELREIYWSADKFALDAAQGESFGNVILEAIGCGVPVTYRARRTRDNTPWEFSGSSGFSYVTSTSKWIEDLLSQPISQVIVDSDGSWLEKYSIDMVSAQLLEIVESNRDESVELRSSHNFISEVGPKNAFHIWVRHNPVVDRILHYRRRLVKVLSAIRRSLR